MKEKILKSNVYQIIIPLDTTLEKIIDTSKFSVKNISDVYLVESIERKTKKQKGDIQIDLEEEEVEFEAEQAEKAKTDAFYEANKGIIG